MKSVQHVWWNSLVLMCLLCGWASSGCMFDQVDLSNKLECQGTTDCMAGFVCACSQCVPPAGAGEACAAATGPAADVGQLEDVSGQADVMTGDATSASGCPEIACGVGERCDEARGDCVPEGCQDARDCPAGERCDDGACVAEERCEAGVRLCDEGADAVLICRADGGVWVREACAEGEVCVEREDGAFCEAEAGCVADGTLRCQGGDVVRCADSGLEYELVETCEDGLEGCDGGACVPLGDLTLSIRAVVLPAGQLEVEYQFSLEASGGREPYRWSIAGGSLPDGVVLSQSGVLSGVPVEEGAFVFDVEVTDASAPAKVAQAELTLVVSGEVLEVVTASLPAGMVGEVYEATLEAEGGTPPYRWGVTSGDLPAGLEVSPAGVLSGVPELAGVFEVTLRVRDEQDVMASRVVDLEIVPAQSQDAGHALTIRSFQEISSTGRRLAISDASNAISGAESIGFGFEFYGQRYERVFVSTEGYLSFEASSVASENVAIPSTSGPGALIAVFWDDLDPATHGDIFIATRGVAPYRRLIVQWKDVAHAQRPESRINAQVVLYETTHQVQLLYGVSSNGPGADMDEIALGESATAGVENPGGTLGEGLHHNVAQIEPGLVWMLTPSGVIYTRESWQSVTGAFETIEGAGLPLILAGTNDSSAETVIGFDFEFYGQRYNSMRVSSNGFVTFGRGGADQATNDPLGTQAAPNAVIAPYWDDLEPGFFAPLFQVLGDAPRRRAVVQWSGFERSGGDLTFQLVLYETSNVIAVRYGSMSFPDALTANGRSATVGIEDASGANAVALSVNAPAVAAGDAVYFVPTQSKTEGYLGVGLTGAYEDISEVGEQLDFGLFELEQEVEIGFDFVMFGGSNATVTVASYGLMLLGSRGMESSSLNQQIPTVGNPEGFLAPFWDDLSPNLLSGGVYVLRRGNFGSRELIVQWERMLHSSDQFMQASFQVVLREQDGRALFRYGPMVPGTTQLSTGSSATIGVERRDGVGGLLYAFDEPGAVSSGLELSIDPR